MTDRPLKNVAGSVHQRLLNKARETGRPFNELLQYYAMERFLYRLSESRQAEDFVLKGALMFRVWKVPVSRPTMDIDLLGRLKNDIEGICAVVRKACSQAVEPDGMTFDAASVTGARLFSCMRTMRISRRAFSGLSEAWAVFTMTSEPNSRRTVPSGALLGSVGPSTARIWLTASGPS